MAVEEKRETVQERNVRLALANGRLQARVKTLEEEVARLTEERDRWYAGWKDAKQEASDAVADKLPINIVFDGPPSHESGRFVEVETDDGVSIRAGEWIEREGGLWALRIVQLPSDAALDHLAGVCSFCGTELDGEDCPKYGDGPEHAPVVDEGEYEPEVAEKLAAILAGDA